MSNHVYPTDGKSREVFFFPFRFVTIKRLFYCDMNVSKLFERKTQVNLYFFYTKFRLKNMTLVILGFIPENL